MVVTKSIILIILTIEIILINKCNTIDSENRNINISDSENNSIIMKNVVYRSIDDNRVNISNFS